MEDRYLEVIREKLADSLEMDFPDLVHRDTELMDLEGKVRAVLGMRRAGKTSGRGGISIFWPHMGEFRKITERKRSAFLMD